MRNGCGRFSFCKSAMLTLLFLLSVVVVLLAICEAHTKQWKARKKVPKKKTEGGEKGAPQNSND